MSAVEQGSATTKPAVVESLAKSVDKVEASDGSSSTDHETCDSTQVPAGAAGQNSQLAASNKASETNLRARAASNLGKAASDLQLELDDQGEDMMADVVNPEWYKLVPVASPKYVIDPILDHVPNEVQILEHDLGLLHKSHHSDAFSVLGAHFHNGLIVVRAWIKDAAEIELKLRENTNFKSTTEGWIPMIKKAEWCYQLAFKIDDTTDMNPADLMYTLRCKYNGSSNEEWHERGDAYNFGLVLSNFDLENFQSGHCWHVDNIMGNHAVTYQGVDGVRFSVWAPNARFVSVVGDFNEWDGRAHPMRKRHEYGVWELFVPTVVAPCQKYGYKIHTRAGTDITKIDPFAQKFMNPPAYDSMISDCDDSFKPAGERYPWGDKQWLKSRAESASYPEYDAKNIMRQPMAIYEVHLPSFIRGDNNSYLNYREIAEPLVAHVKTLNFTHVEFMPLAHHPFEGSWGYQVSGNYAAYSRLGTGDDLKYLIDQLHQNGIGVFIDIVPAHFCKDDWGLARFDGEPLFEYADPREGELKGWGTYCFNFKRSEVRSYLLGAAYHWIRQYHIDGLRVDAVSAMIYRNYCREDGEWIPNEYGGDANLEAISLLQEMNWVVHQNFPGVFMMAEESTSWKGVTNKKDGLGFDAKWDLGWMNDTFSYTCSPDRSSKHSKLTFRGLYVNHESWVLPISHDECVSGKGSILDKMGFSDVNFVNKIKTLKAIFAFQATLPGRPLLMMGTEFGQGREWSEKRSLDWHEAKEEPRSKTMLFLSDILKFYKTLPALHAGDDEAWNFKWHVADDNDQQLIAYTRSYGEWDHDVLFVCNFSSTKKHRYPVGVQHGVKWKVLANSDDWKYGGSMHGVGNGETIATTQGGVLGWPYCLWLDIGAFSCYLLQPDPDSLEVPRQ